MNIFNNTIGDQLLYSTISDISSLHDDPDLMLQRITTSGSSIFGDHNFQPHQNYSQQISDNSLPNILVQIPMCHNTQHLTPNRQQPSEIKSELIKSEIENVTSIIPSTQSTRNTQSSTITSIPNTNICSHQQATSNLITARPKSSIKYFKCIQCPFISISQSGLNSHVDKSHNGNQMSVPKKIKCFGCDNVFYSQNSLKVHLVKDHQMTDDEIKFLVQSLVLDGENFDDSALATPIKQKIYLKKLSILKAPDLSEFENDANMSGTSGSELYHNFNDGNHYTKEFEQNMTSESYDDVPDDFINLIDDELNDQTDEFIDNSTTNDFQNKIYVKDVNNLKSPTFATATQFGFDGGVQNFRIETPEINLIDTPPPPAQTTIQSNFQNQNFVSNYVDSITDMQPKKKPCKIFIENVDILPKPIIIQGSDSNSSPLQYMIPIDVQNQNSFVRNSNEFPFTCLSSPGRPMNENRTSFPNQQKKIFIRNIDILKERVTTSPVAKKNTLHLRTVDDINLMNVNEDDSLMGLKMQAIVLTSVTVIYATRGVSNAQNLIENYQEESPRTPTVTNNSINNYSEIEDYNNINNEQCLETVIEDFVTYYQNNESDKFQFPFQDMHSINFQTNNGNNSDFHLDANSVDFNPSSDPITLENITDSTTSSSIDEKAVNKTEQFNGNNESQLYFNNCDATIRNLNGITDYERAFDEEILFVCAEEVINEQTCESGQMSIDETLSSTQGARNVAEEPGHAKDSCRSEEPAKGRIYVVSNLMKETTESDALIKTTSPEIAEVSSDHQMVEVIESNDEEEVEYVENPKLVQDTTKTLTKRKKAIGRPKGGRNNRYTLNSTNSTDNSPIKYQCTQNCAMRFKSSTILSFHELCHDGKQKNRIICPECQQNDFRNFNTLHTHLWRQHSVDMELYSCAICEFKTPILSRLLNTHMKIHSDERNYKCETCHKAFKNAKQLKNHRVLHNEVRIIRKCDHCDKFFYNKKHLRNHIKSVHDHQKEFKCLFCETIFSSVVSCQTHMRNHTNSKKYECEKCSYATNDRSGYRRHLMIHQDKKSYDCRFCQFQCIQSSQFKSHILKQHPHLASEVLFSCLKCRFVTINHDKFELHQLSHTCKNADAE